MSTAFVPLAERVIDEILASDPELACTAGDHAYDSLLPDHSPDGVTARVAMLRDAAASLSGVDADDLALAERVDYEQLMSLVERTLFELTELREHEWNPLVHNPGYLLNALISRPFAPAAQRVESLIGRLGAIPDSLAIARGVLRDSPHIHLETAATRFRGTAALVRDEFPRLLSEVATLESRALPVAAAAIKALEEFADELSRRAAAGGEGRNPRLGRRLWEAKLWHTLDTELTAADVLRQAWETVDRVTAEIRVAAADFVGGPADDDTVRRALNRLAEERPDDATIVGLAKLTLAETTAFVGAHDLVSLLDDPCEIRVMPEFERGVAIAYCESPGGLEGDSVPSFYCIAPTPQDWSAQRSESFYREYNDYMIRDLTVHEAMPGHFLQQAHSRRYRGSTRVRALARSGTFVEGWAVYAEQIMADQGFGGAPVRLLQLKMQLRMAVNAILDHLVHCEELAQDEAMALMTGRAFQEEGEAIGKWRRALLTSTQLSTYLVGYVEVAAIAAGRPAATAPRTWHDAMLSHGSPAPRHLSTLLLG